MTDLFPHRPCEGHARQKGQGYERELLVGLPGRAEQGALVPPERPVTRGQPGTKERCDAGDAGALGVVRGLLQDMLNERRMINEVQGTGTAPQEHNFAKA